MMKLTKLELNNFQGVRNFTLDIQGSNVKVYGDNGTGKTTIYSAFLWLLFSKNHDYKTDFEIKTLKSDGTPVSGLEHFVEATFDISGITLTLRKVYMEKWTKKRGSATADFTGHETKYYIDGVPSKKNEYTAKVDSIIKEDIFKLLTSPSYFNEQVKWQDRRKTLLEICGDISDAEVIASEGSLAALPTILQGRSIENHRKIIAARRTEINKEIEKIPVRIDEIERNLPNLGGINKASYESEIARLNGEIDEKSTLINNIRNGNAISAKQRLIQEIEISMLQIKQEHQANSGDKVYQLKARIQEENSNATILQSKIDSIGQRKQTNAYNMRDLNDNRERLLKEWHEVNERVFTHESDCACPTCGQSIPEDQVQAAKDVALASFNQAKATRLESIQKTGKQTKEKLDEIKYADERLDREIEKIEGQLKEKEGIVSKLKVDLSTAESAIVDIMENHSYTAKMVEKQKIETEIRDLKEASEQAINDIYSEAIELKAKRDQLQGEIGKFAVVEQSQKRIAELKAQERELAKEFEKLEGELYLTEEFIRTKVNMLEEKINSKFKYAKFKLFSEQINGGLTEVCETLFEGVGYSSGLNNAAKINVGLDIINTLSEHYGFSAPIFIDNRESVVKLIDTKAQVISLVVSGADKTLRVEHIENSLEEAI